MVDEQKETVDKIEKATEKATLDVSEGTDQIKKVTFFILFKICESIINTTQAKTSFLKSRKKQAIIGAIVLVIGKLCNSNMYQTYINQNLQF